MAREIDETFIEEAIERYQRLDARLAEFEKAVSTVEVTVRSPRTTLHAETFREHRPLREG